MNADLSINTTAMRESLQKPRKAERRKCYSLMIFHWYDSARSKYSYFKVWQSITSIDFNFILLYNTVIFKKKPSCRSQRDVRISLKYQGELARSWNFLNHIDQVYDYEFCESSQDGLQYSSNRLYRFLRSKTYTLTPFPESTGSTVYFLFMNWFSQRLFLPYKNWGCRCFPFDPFLKLYTDRNRLGRTTLCPKYPVPMLWFLYCFIYHPLSTYNHSSQWRHLCLCRRATTNDEENINVWSITAL